MDSLKNYGITFAIALLIFGLLALFLAPFAVQSFEGSMGSNKDKGPASEEVSTDPSQNTEEADLSAVQGTSFTVLLAGVDYLPDALSDYATTFAASYTYGQSPAGTSVSDDALSYAKPRTISADSIVLLRIDKEAKTALILSVPSRARVIVGGNSVTLGSVLTAKGINFFRDKITALTGLPIDYYVLFTPRGFVNAINQLGGVSYNVPQNMEYTDPTEGMTISLSAGQQTLSGKTALSMLRYVSYADGDISRMRVAREFAKSLLDNMNVYTTLANAPELFRTLSGYFYSDITAENFASHADLLFSYDKLAVKELQLQGQSFVLEGVEYVELNEDVIISELRPYR